MARSLPAVLAVLALVPPAVAADKPPAFEDAVRPTVAGLSADPAVRAELKLTAGQADELAAARAAEEAAYVKAVKAAGATPTAEAVAKLVADTRAAAAKAVDRVLTDAQRKRLRQIDLQDRGPAAFDDPDVQKALAVTAEQRKKWGELKDQFDVRLGKLKREAGGVTTARTIPDTDLPQSGQESLAGKTVRDLKKEHWLAAKNVLTPDQLNKWYDLIGDPFPPAPKK